MTRRPLAYLGLAACVSLVLALTALTGGRFTSYTGGVGSLTTAPGRWWTLWAVPPVEVITILAGGAFVAWYAHQRGLFGTAQRWWLAGALAILLLAVCSPLAGLAQGGILWAHMVQHTLIGGFAPVGVLLAWPRRVPGQTPPPYRWVQVLGNPGVALALWTATMALWLYAPVHHVVLEHETLWVLQQLGFFVLGVVLWLPIVERGVEVPRWFGTPAKVVYLSVVWFVGVIIANIYWFSGTAFYASHANAARVWGLDPLEDQANAGTAMVAMHCLLTITAAAWLFFRYAHENGLAQRLRDAGVDDETVAEALRRGDLNALAVAHHVPVQVRAGID